MPISIFVLALWVFLQSAATYAWFTVDPKLVAFIGIVFVVLVLVEAWFVGYRGRPLLPFHMFRRSGE